MQVLALEVATLPTLQLCANRLIHIRALRCLTAAHLIRTHLGEETIWHSSTDATAIEAREKPHIEAPLQHSAKTPSPRRANANVVARAKAKRAATA